MTSKWIVVALTVATLTSGCAAFGRSGGGSRESSGGGGGTIAEGDLMRIEEAANRAEAAANRAEVAADRALMASQRSETMFHKGLRK